MKKVSKKKDQVLVQKLNELSSDSNYTSQMLRHVDILGTPAEEVRTKWEAKTAYARENNSIYTQWELTKVSLGDSTCVCGQKHIKKICTVRNYINSNELEVGSCCMERVLGINTSPAFAFIISYVEDKDKLRGLRKLFSIIDVSNVVSPKEIDFIIKVGNRASVTPNQLQWKNDIADRLYNHMTATTPAASPNVYVHQKNDKINTQLKLERKLTRENQWGSTYLILKLSDNSNNKYTAFYNSDYEEIDVNNVYEIEATVQDLNEYKNEKSHLLNIINLTKVGG